MDKWMSSLRPLTELCEHDSTKLMIRCDNERMGETKLTLVQIEQDFSSQYATISNCSSENQKVDKSVVSW